MQPSYFYIFYFAKNMAQLGPVNKNSFTKLKKDETGNPCSSLLGNRGGSNPRPSESQSDALTN